MTAIIAWRSPAGMSESVHVVADSRISNSSSMLLDEAAKVLPVHIRASCGDPEAPHGMKCYFAHSIGYAFAGSTLIGLNTYAHLATRLGSLIGLNSTNVPTLAHYAQLGAELLANQSVAWKARHGGDNPCSALVFGYCLVAQEPQVFQLRPDGFGQVSIRDPREFAHIGQCEHELALRIDEERRRWEENDSRWWSAPKKVLEEFIDSEQFDGIGGPLTLAIASADGFQLFSEANPVVGNRRGVLTSGFFGDLHTVGPCFVGPGIALREP